MKIADKRRQNQTCLNFVNTHIIVVVLLLASCSEYLDVVPDNTLKLENIYATKDDAYNALAKIYNYIPDDWSTHTTMWEMGDEYIGRIDASVQNSSGNLRAERVMRGLQVTGDPLLGNWSGTNGGKHYYRAIRSTNVFLDYIKWLSVLVPKFIF